MSYPVMLPTIPNDLAEEIDEELHRAIQKFPKFNSPHEGWAVIYEELIVELGAHVWNNTGRTAEARHEAIQIAAMAIRYVLDVSK